MLVLRSVSAVAVVVVVAKAATPPDSVRRAYGFNVHPPSPFPPNVRGSAATSAMLIPWCDTKASPPDFVRQADGLCVR